MAKFVIHVKELARKKPPEPKQDGEAPGSEGLERATPVPVRPDYEVLIVGHRQEPLNQQRASELLQIVNDALGWQEPFHVEPTHEQIHMYASTEALEQRVAAYELAQTPPAEHRILADVESDWRLRQIIRRTRKREFGSDSHVPTEEEHGLSGVFLHDLGLARQTARLIGDALKAQGHQVNFRGMRRGE